MLRKRHGLFFPTNARLKVMNTLKFLYAIFVLLVPFFTFFYYIAIQVEASALVLIILFLPHLSCAINLFKTGMSWKRLIRFSILAWISILLYYLLLPLNYALSNTSKEFEILFDLILGLVYILIIIMYIYIIIAPLKPEWWPSD
jgi:hypothetical protein